MEQKSCLRLIYKLESKQLKQSGWNLVLPLEEAIATQPRSVVSLADSQVMRFIDEINGIADVSGQVKNIQKRINYIKKQPKSAENKKEIRKLYSQMYKLQFQEDS